MSLSNIRIVLVCPSHPGNIGATARAMKNMGLSQLALVRPDRFPDGEARARAAGADDILEAATVHDSLEAALTGCHYVVGTTARERTIEWPVMDPRACAAELVIKAQAAEVALIFGRERTGLLNDEVDRCQALVRIPTSANHSSLNLASAVLVLAYELRLAHLGADGADIGTPAAVESTAEPVASSEDLERFYGHLEQVLVEIGFLDPDNPRMTVRRLRRLYNRSAVTENELQILRGMLTAVQQTQYWRKKT